MLPAGSLADNGDIIRVECYINQHELLKNED
jgi:hypothetical protein